MGYRGLGVLVAGSALVLAGCSAQQPSSPGAGAASSSPSAGAPSEAAPSPTASPTSDELGPFPMGAKGTYPDGVGVQVTHIRSAGKNKVTFVLLIDNGSTTAVRPVDFVGATRGTVNIDADGFPVDHAVGQKPQWDVDIPAGRSEGQIFTLEAPTSALKDIAIAYDGVGHEGGDQEGIPIVFRGNMTP